MFVGFKGIVAIRLEIDQSTKIVFANMHLPAGEGKAEQRCKLWSKFQKTYGSFAAEDRFIFALGDQNWRTTAALSVNDILKLIAEKDYEAILKHDEVRETDILQKIPSDSTLPVNPNADGNQSKSIGTMFE